MNGVIHSRFQAQDCSGMAASSKYSFHFCPSVASSSDGATTTINYKCWKYTDDGSVWWELRRIARPILMKENMELNKTMKANDQVLSAVAASIGAVWLDEYMVSRKAAEARGIEELVGSEKLRQEAGVSTLGLLILLLGWSFARHRGEERSRALCSLEAWLMKVGDASLLPFNLWEDVCTDPLRARCPNRRDGDRMCVHIAKLMTFSDSSTWRELAMLLHSAIVDATVCPSAAGLAEGFVRKIAQGVNGRVDQISLPTNILKEEHFMAQSGKRKARVDEDFIELVSQEKVRQKKIHCGSQLARATGDVPESACRAWDEQFLCRYQAEAWKQFASATFVSVAEDGKRIGQPAEETQMYVAWTPTGDKAAVLPPQALRGPITIAMPTPEPRSRPLRPAMFTAPPRQKGQI